MATKLFVAKLSFDSTDDTLNALFAAHGTVVSATIIKDRDTGRSKGFGFVEMEKDDEAQTAIKTLDNTEFEGRTIAVSVARPREERPASGNSYRGGFQSR